MESTVVDSGLIEMLEEICWEKDIAARKNTLFRFKQLLRKIPAPKRAALANRISSTDDYKLSLGMSLLHCGDHEFQECLIEILTRVAWPLKDWKNVLETWFSDFPSIVDAVGVLDAKDFNVTSRTFLNRVNSPSCLIQSGVHSVPCIYAAVSGRIQLEKPPGYDELWFDCSPGTGEIQLLINGGDGNWARVVLHPACIQSIKCSHRPWRLPLGDVESSQLLIKLNPSAVVPFEDPVSFSELAVVLKKDVAFQKLENDFLKRIYARCYEPARAKLVDTRGRKTINQSLSTTSFITRSSNSTKLSFLNVSLSTIEKDPSLIALGVQNSSSVSDDVIPKVKQIATSTPLKFKAGKTVRKVENVSIDEVKEGEEVGTNIKSRHRSSISAQITFGSRRKGENSHQEDESTRLNESPPNQPNLPEASADNLSYLRDICTKEKELTFQNKEQALTADSRAVAQPQSPVHIDKLCNTPANQLVDGEEQRHFQDNTSYNPKKLSIPETPASEYVFGAQHTTLLDFKGLHPQSVMAEPSPSPHTFSGKFFSRFQKPFDNMSDSEMSMSSTSKISNRPFRGVVQIRNSSLDLSKCVEGKAGTKTSQKHVDPFSYTEDNDDIESYERVAEDLKGKFRTPASVRKKRKLYTPGKDDALHSDGKESPSHGCQNHKLLTRNQKRKKVTKCLLDLSCDGIRGKKNSADKMLRRSSRKRKKISYEEISSSYESGGSCIEPRVSRTPGKTEPLRSEGVTLSPPTPSGSVPRKVDVDLDALSPPGPLTAYDPEPALSSPPPQQVEMVQISPPPKCKPARVRPKRGKNVVSQGAKGPDNGPGTEGHTQTIPPTPSGSVPRKIDVDLDALSPPGPLAAYEPEPALSSPPPQQVEMVQISPPPKCKPARVRPKKGKMVAIQGAKGPDNGPGTEGHTQTIPGYESNVMCTQSCTNQPKPLNEENVVSVEASSISLVQLGDSHLSGWIDGLSDLILSQVKTYVIGVKNDNSSLVESIGVNLSTCLETLKTTMNTIREESLNISRASAIIQSASENCIASSDVVHEMLKSIEEVHHGSVSESIRNNDPRTYSKLRQQIYLLIKESIGKKTK